MIERGALAILFMLALHASLEAGFVRPKNADSPKLWGVEKGIAIGEVPVTVMRRASGESKKGRDLSYGLSFARTVLKTWWR